MCQHHQQKPYIIINKYAVCHKPWLWQGSRASGASTIDVYSFSLAGLCSAKGKQLNFLSLSINGECANECGVIFFPHHYQ